MTSHPLVLSVCDRYRPTVELFLAHVDELRASSRWDESFRQARDRARSSRGGGFELDGHGVFRHVLLAPGHPGLALPAELEDDPRVVHAYEPHEYASRVAIVGAGMAAATEWLNALAAGAEVVSVRRREPAPAAAQRRPAAVQQARPRRVPRDAARTARRAPPRLRRAVLPARPQLGRAARAGRARGPLPGRARSERRRAGHLRHGLSARLRARPAARAPRRRARPRDRGALDRARRRLDGPGAHRRDAHALARAASPAQWAFPAADTLVGMKIAARGFRTQGRVDVLHAERSDRDAARGCAAAVPRRRRARRRSCTCGGRSSWPG